MSDCPRACDTDMSLGRIMGGICRRAANNASQTVSDVEQPAAWMESNLEANLEANKRLTIQSHHLPKMVQEVPFRPVSLPVLERRESHRVTLWRLSPTHTHSSGHDGDVPQVLRHNLAQNCTRATQRAGLIQDVSHPPSASASASGDARSIDCRSCLTLG